VSKAIVKCVLSGDTLIIRGKPTGNQPPREKQISLAYIQAPRMGNQKKDDEPFAFESREFLRCQIVGKEITFRIDYTIPTTNREYGSVFLGSENITQLIVREGWAKVREDGRKNKDDSRGEEVNNLSALENTAQGAGKGIWGDKDKYSRNVNYTLQEDARTYLNKYKGLKIDGIIEQVRDGSSLRVLFIPPAPAPQQYLNINISGIKAPTVRKDIPDVEDLVEPYGEEAKYFVESRLLQRNVKVILEGLSGNNQTFYATILHPAGNIAESLVAVGLAKVADWSITVVTDGPIKLREAEKKAKEKRLRLWQDHVVRSKAGGDDHDFEGIDPKCPEYNFEAKEFLRKKLIGKPVRVIIDYQKPASEGYEAKECATIKLGEFNPAEALIERGLAHIIRHKRDDEDRSSCYDQLLIADQNTKEPPVYRISDVSEACSSSKARQFLHSLQRYGRVPGVIDFVNNGSRFKIYIPKESYKLTFVLSGIRCPRPGRTPTDKSEPFATEALEFATRKVLQRDVEIEVENVDKVGGFIGSLWLNKTENFATLLLQEGLATVHSFSADQSPYSRELYAAEQIAKDEKKNIWSFQDSGLISETNDTATADEAEPRKEYVDVVVSEIVSGGHFYVQVVNDSNIRNLEKMMSDFGFHHKSTTAISNFDKIKTGQIVSAQFTEDDQWYRARIRKNIPEKESVEVVYIDYGNSETIPVSRIRSIPDNFKQLPPHAYEAMLSFLKVPDREADYGGEAYERLRDFVDSKQLVANIDHRDNNVLHLTLYDPAQSESSDASINAEMVRDGLGLVNNKLPYIKKYSNLVKKLLEVQEQAKKDRVGMFEYGDVTADDDERDY
ncbi:19201_t:CDS:10, partial [Cetraspora pellucida]